MNKETRRSGNDRRARQEETSLERRNNPEKREVVKDYDHNIEIMKKIPIFHGLTDDDYLKILQLCQKMIIKKDQIIIRKGEESNELFILLKGKLKVILSTTSFLTYIFPIGLIGEIGFFTGMRRSATVLASTESTLIKIHKHELFNLFKNNSTMGYSILLNAISDLANKLLADNEYIEELQNKKRTRKLYNTNY